MNVRDIIPIPYGGGHIGPRRTLTIVLRKAWGLNPNTVHVNIDGSDYVLPWGPASFDVPADRPVSVSVYQRNFAERGLARTMLMPEAPPELEYRPPYAADGPGSIGPPGATRPRRRGLVAILVSFGGIVLLALIVVAIVFLMMWLLVRANGSL